MQPASSALPSEADVRPTRPLDLQAMARCNPRDDALVVHDKCVPRARQCTTLEKGPARIIVQKGPHASSCTTALQWHIVIANARSAAKTSQLFLTATAFFCLRNAI